MAAASDRPSTKRIVLVPGFWLGAWAWDEVAALLRDRGLDVVALTLPGLDGAGLDGAGLDDAGLDAGQLDATSPPASAVSLEDHVAAIIAAVGEGPVVLVAHSGAAAPATVALDRAPDAVAHVVWVDTCPVVDGQAMDASFEGDAMPLDAAWDREFEDGSMRDLTEAQLERFRARAVPEPAGAIRDPAVLRDERRLDVPQTLVATAFSAADYRAYAEEGASFLQGLGEQRALELVELPTGHWPMWSKPTELAALIAERAV